MYDGNKCLRRMYFGYCKSTWRLYSNDLVIAFHAIHTIQQAHRISFVKRKKADEMTDSFIPEQ